MRAEHLWKAYGAKAVLRDLSFSVERGERLCVYAPSGGGKTTLLRIVLGLERPDRGAVSDVGIAAAVFQENRLLLEKSALANLLFVRPDGVEAGRQLLEELHLPVSAQPTAEFSGGMRRRVALARALLVPSDTLVLDEPFTGLDGETRQAAMDCLRRHGAGKTILMATHDRRDAAELGAGTLLLPSADGEI